MDVYTKTPNIEQQVAQQPRDPAKVYDFDLLLKTIFIGDCGVGKTSLNVRFADGVFHDCWTPTIGVDFKIKTIDIGKKRVKVN